MNSKKIFLLAIGVIVLVVGLLCFRPVSYKNLPPTASGEWIAFGDSITAGYGAQAGNDYPTLLAQKLGIPIHNLGVPGETTEGGLNRVGEAVKLQPRVVLLCLGGNDGLQKVSPETMISNLSTIIDAFQQAGSFVILIGVHSASLRDTNASRFKKLAHEKGAFYVSDILDGVLGSPNLMSDYIHPNDEGYKAIAARMEKILDPLLSQIKGS